MKHTSRKKMLLSSIAMLLVALVALGSATYAWFTQNKTVTADGFKAKAASSVGIKILSKSEADSNAAKSIDNAATYGISTTLYTGITASKVLEPISVVPGTTFNPFSTTAYSSGNAARLDSNTKGAAVETYSGTGYYSENVYVVLTGDNDDTQNKQEDVYLRSINMTTTSDAMAAGLRAIVTYTDAAGTTKLVGQYAPTQKTNTAYSGAVAADTVATSSNSSSITFKPVGGGEATAAGKVNETAGVNFFTVYVYLDGEDPTVFTDGVSAADLITKVDLSFGID